MIPRLAPALALLLLGSGCGIPKDKHAAVLKDLAACQDTLAASKNKLDTVTTERDTARSDLKAMGGEKDELAKRKEELAKQLGATQKEIDELRKAREQAEARMKTFRQLAARLKAMVDSGQLKVEIRKGRMIVKLSDKILFDPGKVKLKKEGEVALQELTAVLKDIEGRDFLVAGHTDNTPMRNWRYRSNWELSAARAVQVVKFMQGQGVDPRHLGAAGFSEFDPVGDNSTGDGKRTNRRIEIVLMPKLGELPKIGL